MKAISKTSATLLAALGILGNPATAVCTTMPIKVRDRIKKVLDGEESDEIEVDEPGEAPAEEDDPDGTLERLSLLKLRQAQDREHLTESHEREFEDMADAGAGRKGEDLLKIVGKKHELELKALGERFKMESGGP